MNNQGYNSTELTEQARPLAGLAGNRSKLETYFLSSPRTNRVPSTIAQSLLKATSRGR
jgi:hypothetical protein